jgi:hypothetical protein
MESLPTEVEIEIGVVIAVLNNAGWQNTSSRYDAKIFGNWCIDFCRGGQTIRLVKDRSQYMIFGSQEEEIKAAGLFRAFDDLHEFRQSVSQFINNPT